MPSNNSANVSSLPVISKMESLDCGLKISWDLALYHLYVGGLITVSSADGDSASNLTTINLTAEELYEECFIIDGLTNGVKYAITLTAVVRDDGEEDGEMFTSTVAIGTPVGVPSAPTVTVAIDENFDTVALVTVTLGSSNGDPIDSVLIHILDITLENTPLLTNQTIALTARQQSTGVVEVPIDVVAAHTYLFSAVAMNNAGASLPSDPSTKFSVARLDTPTLELVSTEHGLDDDGLCSEVTLRGSINKGRIDCFHVYLCNTLEQLEANLADDEYLGYTVDGSSPTEEGGDVYELLVRPFEGYDNSIAAGAIIAVSNKGTKSEPVKFGITFGQPGTPDMLMGVIPTASSSDAVKALHAAFKTASTVFDKLSADLKTIEAIQSNFASSIKPLTQRVLESQLGRKLSDAIHLIHQALLVLFERLGIFASHFSADELDGITQTTTFQELWESESAFFFVRLAYGIYKALRDSKFAVDKVLLLTLFNKSLGSGMYQNATKLKLSITNGDKDVAKDMDVTDMCAYVVALKAAAEDVYSATLSQATTITDDSSDIDLMSASKAAKAARAARAEWTVAAGACEAEAAVPKPLLAPLSVIVEPNSNSILVNIKTAEASSEHASHRVTIWKASDLVQKAAGLVPITNATSVAEFMSNSEFLLSGNCTDETFMINFKDSNDRISPLVGATFDTDTILEPNVEYVLSVSCYDNMSMTADVYSKAFKLDDASPLSAVDLKSWKADAKQRVSVTFQLEDLNPPAPGRNAGRAARAAEVDPKIWSAVVVKDSNGTVVASLECGDDVDTTKEQTIEFDSNLKAGTSEVYALIGYASDSARDYETASAVFRVNFADRPSIGAVVYNDKLKTVSFVVQSNGAVPTVHMVLFDTSAQPHVLGNDAFECSDDAKGKYTFTADVTGVQPYTSDDSVAALVIATNSAAYNHKITAAWDELFKQESK